MMGFHVVLKLSYLLLYVHRYGLCFTHDTGVIISISDAELLIITSHSWRVRSDWGTIYSYAQNDIVSLY